MLHVFPQIFIDDEEPQDLTQLININDIQRVFINRAENDHKRTGNFYVWIALYYGEIIPVHKGTLNSCKENLQSLKMSLDKHQWIKENSDGRYTR